MMPACTDCCVHEEESMVRWDTRAAVFGNNLLARHATRGNGTLFAKNTIKQAKKRMEKRLGACNGLIMHSFHPTF